MDNQNFSRDLHNDFLERMKAARDDSDLKQSDVVKRLEEYGVKMGPSTYAKVERGERKLEFSEALAISQVLGFSVSDMAPEPVKASEQMLKRANSVFGQAIEAEKLALDAQVPVRRAILAIESLEDEYSRNGDLIRDDLDRKLIETLIKPEVREMLKLRQSSLQSIADWYEHFNRLDFDHRAEKFTRDFPAIDEPPIPDEPDWDQSRFGYWPDVSES